MPNCSEATCQGNGVITVSPRHCPRVQKPTCANGYSAVQVTDHDGCCSHYQCPCECAGRGTVAARDWAGQGRGREGRTELGWTQGGHPKIKAQPQPGCHVAPCPGLESPGHAGARRRRESGPLQAPAGQSCVRCQCMGPGGKAVTCSPWCGTMRPWGGGRRCGP